MHKARNLNNGTLIQIVSHEAGVSPAVVERVLRAAFDVIGRTVISGFKVSVTNFGTFRSIELPARSCRNPQTGEYIDVQKMRYPRFTWSPAVRRAAKSGQVPETLKKKRSDTAP